jgi:predicted Zn-dependent protease
LRKTAAGVLALALALAGAAHAYPIARERELGERFALEAATALPILREPAVVDFVGHIGREMVARLGSPQPFEYRFSVVRDPQLNAFAVPGGFVYVNAGLLARVKNDSELAGVLGHEIGHTHAHHIVRQQEKTQLVSYGALAGMLLSVIHPAIGAAAMGAAGATQLKYQREFEQEADYLGLRYMREAGFDPHGMASFMKRIWEEQRGNPTDLPPYLLSHPLTDERITNLEAATKDIPPKPGWQQPSWRLRRMQAILHALTDDRVSTRARYEAAAGSSAEDLALHGIVLLYHGDAAAGRAALEKARADGARDLEGDIGLARLRQGDLEGALAMLRARTEADPTDAVAHAWLGAALMQKGEFAAAQKELTAALQQTPELDEAEYDLGQSLGRAGQAGEGMYHLAHAFEMRGEIERALGQYEKAEKLLPPGSAEAEEAKQRGEWLRQIVTQRVIGR